MSKRADTTGLDPYLVINQAKRSNREQRAAPAPPPASEPLPVPEETQPQALPVQESEREPEPPREEPRRRKNREQEYESLFFKEASIKTRNGKVVYIRKEFHDRILKIVQVIGENEFSLFSYLDNILENHFNTYQEVITELYRKKYTDIF